MSSPSAQPQNPPAHVAMFQILNGIAVASTVALIARLSIPDLVEHGPRSIDDLARQTSTHAPTLYRLLRASASVGVLSENSDGTFSETPLSAVLRSNAQPSLRMFAIMHGTTWHCRTWENLEYSVRTGNRAFDHALGTNLFGYFKDHPVEAAEFNQCMTDLSTVDSPAVVDAYDFSGIGSIVDIAGGHGLLLATILARNPHLKGTLYDLPHVVEGAKNAALKPVIDRCSVASGDMFSSVPAGADAYIMKHIIHDWTDEQCIQLLKACRNAVNPGGRLLVVDNVVPGGNDFHPGKFLDIQMLLFPGGRERTEKEFRELFASAGWKLTRVITTRVPESIVEALPA
jgi:O-methyltransferase domain